MAFPGADTTRYSPILRSLDTVGDGSGTMNAVGNYVTPTTFKITCPSGKKYNITEMLVHISGATNFSIGAYGNIAGGRTNGVKIQFTVGGVTSVLNTGEFFKTNDDWAHVSSYINHIAYAGGGDSIVVPFSITDFGIPLQLSGGDSLEVVLNDNFTTLVSHHFVAHGYST